jgi:hypothetical protein
MARLPDAHRVVVDPEKLRDYVLSSDHEHGRHKARVFLSALGIDRDNWEYLREQIVAGLVDAEVSEVRTGAIRVAILGADAYRGPKWAEARGHHGLDHRAGGRASAPDHRLRQCPLSRSRSSMSSS